MRRFINVKKYKQDKKSHDLCYEKGKSDASSLRKVSAFSR